VIALGARHLGAHVALHLLLHRRDRKLAAQQRVDAPQPAHGIDDLEHFLSFVDAEPEVRRHQIREAARIVYVGGDRQDLGRQVPERQQLFNLLAHGSNQRLDFHAPTRRRGRLESFDPDVHVRLGAQIVGDLDLAETLNQHLEAAVGQPHHSHDHPDTTDRVEVLGGRFVDVSVALRNQRQQSIALHRLFDRLDRDVAADEQRKDHRGKHHCISNGKQRQALWYFEGTERVFHYCRSMARRRTETTGLKPCRVRFPAVPWNWIDARSLDLDYGTQSKLCMAPRATVNSCNRTRGPPTSSNAVRPDTPAKLATLSSSSRRRSDER